MSLLAVCMHSWVSPIQKHVYCSDGITVGNPRNNSYPPISLCGTTCHNSTTLMVTLLWYIVSCWMDLNKWFGSVSVVFDISLPRVLHSQYCGPNLLVQAQQNVQRALWWDNDETLEWVLVGSCLGSEVDSCFQFFFLNVSNLWICLVCICLYTWGILFANFCRNYISAQESPNSKMSAENRKNADNFQFYRNRVFMGCAYLWPKLSLGNSAEIAGNSADICRHFFWPYWGKHSTINSAEIGLQWWNYMEFRRKPFLRAKLATTSIHLEFSGMVFHLSSGRKVWDRKIVGH